MAHGPRTCTECDAPVSARKGALTCSPRCRTKRSVRIRTARATGRDVQALITDDAEVAGREVLREELRPHVREYITDQVLDGIKTLIGSIPKAIAKAAEDLDSEDDVTRQKAYSLILRYSIGNGNIVPDINADRQQELTVQFNLPRPSAEDLLGPAPAAKDSGVIETKECDSCGETKALTEFVANSDRCQSCFDRMRASISQLGVSEQK